MEIKVLRVFYDKEGYPFKDQERAVRFPIIGSGFQGASNTTEIRFYFKDLGTLSTTWVATSKLPNGKIGSKVLQTYLDSELNEYYAKLDLSSYYFQYKGDVFISLQGYEGGVNYSYNSETELYEIYGTPTIRATGSIKLAVNYATQFIGSGEEENVDMQSILALLGDKLDKEDSIIVYSGSITPSQYSEGQVLYDSANKILYKIISGNLEQQSSLTIDSSMSGSSTNSVQNKVIKAYVDSATSQLTLKIDNNFAKTMQFLGLKTVAEINALNPSSLKVGDTYAVTTSGYLSGTIQVLSGDNVVWTGTKWDKFAANSNFDLDDFYTKNQINAIVETIKRNAYQDVDTEEYPTLNDFLASTGEEGIIYLYPVNTVDLSQGYKQYIYESGSWRYLGDTILDLDNYYTMAETQSAIPQYQTTMTIIRGLRENINGRYLTSYEANYQEVGGYPAYVITYGGVKCTEERASNYMRFMCGSRFLPTYDFDYPQNTIFMTAQGKFYKPQYDSTNGLVLYEMASPFFGKYGDLIPSANANYNIGSSSYKFNEIYLTTYAYFTNNSKTLKIGTNNSGTFLITYTGTDVAFMSSASTWNFNCDVLPYSSNSLGSSSKKWFDIYLSGNLSDGTNSYTVSESFGVIFNKLANGTTTIKWSELCLFDLTTNTTFTFETPKSSSVPEYKAIINNNGSGSITLTFTGVTNILCNDDNCTITNGTDSTLVLPTGVSVEISVLDNMMVAINFEAQ